MVLRLSVRRTESMIGIFNTLMLRLHINTDTVSSNISHYVPCCVGSISSFC